MVMRKNTKRLDTLRRLMVRDSQPEHQFDQIAQRLSLA